MGEDARFCASCGTPRLVTAPPEAAPVAPVASDDDFEVTLRPRAESAPVQPPAPVVTLPHAVAPAVAAPEFPAPAPVAQAPAAPVPPAPTAPAAPAPAASAGPSPAPARTALAGDAPAWLAPGRTVEDLLRGIGIPVLIALAAGLLAALLLGAIVGISVKPAAMLAAMLTIKVVGIDVLGGGTSASLALPITALFLLPAACLAGAGALTVRRLSPASHAEAARLGAAAGVAWMLALLVIGLVWGGARPHTVEVLTIGVLYGGLLGAGGALWAAGRDGADFAGDVAAKRLEGPLEHGVLGLLEVLKPAVLAALGGTLAVFMPLLAIALLDEYPLAAIALLALLILLFFGRSLARRLSGRGQVATAQLLAAAVGGCVLLLLVQSVGLLVAIGIATVLPATAASGAFLALGGSFEAGGSIGFGVIGSDQDLGGTVALWRGGEASLKIALSMLLAGAFGAIAAWRGLVAAGQRAAVRSRATTAGAAARAGATIALPALVLALAARSFVRFSPGGGVEGVDVSFEFSPSLISVLVGVGVISALLGALGGRRAFQTGHAQAGDLSALGHSRLLWWCAAPLRRCVDTVALLVAGLRGREIGAPRTRPARRPVDLAPPA